MQNVSEIYPLYDTVIVSQRLWGNESKVKGWFGGHAGAPWTRPWEQFGDTPEHIFFKDRTEGNSDLAYCNLQSAETMDFAYRLYSIGVRFWGPISAFETAPQYDGDGAGMPPWGTILLDDPMILHSCWGHMWKAEVPMHCGFEFKVEQDVILEGPAMTFPPGHGFTGAGSSWSDPVSPGYSPITALDACPVGPHNMNIDLGTVGTTDPAPGSESIVQHPQMISVVNQGHPRMGNRFLFARRNPKTGRMEPQPIEIPRGALMQAKIILSPYVQYLLNDFLGPLYYLFNRRCPRQWSLASATTPTEVGALEQDYNTWFGVRYGITVSLMGERLVQQRGQYWAPGAVGSAIQPADEDIDEE